MNRSRTCIAFLLTLALPYAATASIGDGLQCQHAGTHAWVAVAMPHAHSAMSHAHAALPQEHAAISHAHHATGHATVHHDCACPLTCDCAQHCAGIGGAVLPLQDQEIAGNGGVERPPVGYAALIHEAWHSPAFRPPIAALPGAA